MLPSCGIQGLTLLIDKFDHHEEDYLLKMIDDQNWDTTLSRRTQQYGYKYNYIGHSLIIIYIIDEDFLYLF